MRSATSSAIPESFPNPDTLVPRSFTTTRAPRSARSSTYARPSPRPAPVTTATFPPNEIRSVISRPSFDKSSRSPVQGHWPATCSHDADAHQASSELRLTVTAAPGSWGGCDRGSWLLGRPASEPGTLFQDDRAQGRGHRRRRTFILPILQTLSRIDLCRAGALATHARKRFLVTAGETMSRLLIRHVQGVIRRLSSRRKGTP